MVVFAFSVGLFGWLANFDQAFGGIVLLMPAFKKSFGTCADVASDSGTTMEECSLTALQQSLVQLSILFMSVGGVASGFTSHRIGRRGTLQLACAIIAVSAAGMLGTAGSFLNFMVCKCIGGIGIGMIYAAAPTWGSESVASQSRGFLMSFYNVGLASGNVIMAAVCAGSSKINSNWSWQVPILCQIPAAVVLAAGSMLFPESPRWLLLKGREEAARKSFAKFNKTEPNSPQINALVEEINGHIELELTMRRSTDWTNIFRGINLKRTHLAVLILVSNAISGIQFVIPYTALFLAQIGLNNPYILNVAISSCILAGTVPGPFLCEYAGRRLSLIGGYIVMAACMLIFAVVASVLGQSAVTAQHVLVAFLCIWAFTFGATSGPIVWVSSAEMHSLRLRSFGQSYAVMMYEVFSFGAAFWTPYMLNTDYGNMGTNVGYFYGGITLVIVVLTVMFVPETARLSLEQIDTYFMEGTPAWKTNIRENKKIALTEGMNMTNIKGEDS
ncbi:general substrate transporter [Ilyonectria destructans]|nr:general substrate transporter [Ilyonectria destructans]